ncbi:unnamed protein product [Paramecium sonneborni]|uniref:Uncharacterized protein n=1 Tax=Paramecium sonneborni TaxID=65129 RepID=A0A8S1MR47_9CILI|nr:unnamed protein product [Paramecium sonneborni]
MAYEMLKRNTINIHLTIYLPFMLQVYQLRFKRYIRNTQTGLP